ncbi:Protein HYPER-SENSITIVITY-RELATED 4 [Camellia lanceoleosa]|uniref:Protein HYPER-SENSITIVITY-RELATED 4 n=1 Tax=Camellia lanceoleosa TaxID=1840588 RepID=A0ACC0IHR5_9ERIC|nr:Protein HYPER-SENSITIVITY-RELATED 4 [Camellia lanceoleosa]
MCSQCLMDSPNRRRDLCPCCVFSNAFALLLKLWRFNHPPLEHGVGNVPPVGSQLTPEYLLLVRNSHLVSSGNIHSDRYKRRLSAVASSSPPKPIFVDSFPKLKVWYRQHQACIASTLSGLVHGTPVYQIVDGLLNMMFRKINRASSSVTCVTSGSSSSSGPGNEDTSARPKLPAWDVLEAVPFVVDAALTAFLSTYTTFAASAMLVRSVLNEVQAMTKRLIPQQFHDKILSKMGGLLGNFSSQMILVIDETNGLSFNEIFEASEIYLRLKISPSVERLKVSKAPGEKDLCVSINQGEKIVDTFEGVQVTWQMICIETQKTSTDYEGGFETNMAEHRSIELCFHKKYREMVLSFYLPYILERSKAMKEENKVVKLNSCYGAWDSINLNHPSTFDTLAMDPTLKKEVIDDLDRFVKRKDFYRRVGKAWKRGYLLSGPPGTGKSSLIAAMANYLKFHIYDLELTSLQSDAELRRLLIYTANKSILVIEDTDCSSNFQN